MNPNDRRRSATSDGLAPSLSKVTRRYVSIILPTGAASNKPSDVGRIPVGSRRKPRSPREHGPPPRSDRPLDPSPEVVDGTHPRKSNRPGSPTGPFGGPGS